MERKTKKSESLEVRISHELKRDFMRKAEADGTSASDLVRQFIGDYLASQERKRSPMFLLALKPTAAIAAAAIGVAWVAVAPTPVSATPDLKVIFDQFDGNRDGSISSNEFKAAMGANRMVIRAPVPPPEKQSRPYPGPANGGGSADVLIGPGGALPPPGSVDAQPMILPLGDGAPPQGAVLHGPAADPNREFTAQDSDADGTISFDEFQNHHKRMMRAGFDRHDLNRDGVIDETELSSIRKLLPPGLIAPDYSRMDKNKDGKIAPDEFGS